MSEKYSLHILKLKSVGMIGCGVGAILMPGSRDTPGIQFFRTSKKILISQIANRDTKWSTNVHK